MKISQNKGNHLFNLQFDYFELRNLIVYLHHSVGFYEDAQMIGLDYNSALATRSKVLYDQLVETYLSASKMPDYSLEKLNEFLADN